MKQKKIRKKIYHVFQIIGESLQAAPFDELNTCYNQVTRGVFGPEFSYQFLYQSPAI